jgi:hypothetical protein
MPEVKASPATPDKSLSHSRYSLAIDIFGWKIQVLRRNPSGAWFGRLREGVRWARLRRPLQVARFLSGIWVVGRGKTFCRVSVGEEEF